MNPQIHKIYLIFTTDIVDEDAAEVDEENKGSFPNDADEDDCSGADIISNL